MKETIQSQSGVVAKYYVLNWEKEYDMLIKQFYKIDEVTEQYKSKASQDFEFANFYEKNHQDELGVAKQVARATKNIVQSREAIDDAEINLYGWKEMLENVFLNDVCNDASVFVLYNEKEVPVCFTIFTAKQEGKMCLELVVTHANYDGQGYGKELIEKSFENLNANGITNIISVVGNENESSIAMHQKLAKDYSCNTYIEDGTKNIIFDYDTMKKAQEM